MCSNKWYTRSKLLLRRGYNAYKANELNAEKIKTFSDHLNYEAVVQVRHLGCMGTLQDTQCNLGYPMQPDMKQFHKLFTVDMLMQDRYWLLNAQC